MSEFDYEELDEVLDEVLANPVGALPQMLAIQLKREIKRIKELEAENARLRQQLNSANSQIQILNQVIAGDIE